VYQGGRIEIGTNGYGSPETRGVMAAHGVDLRLKSDLRYKLFTPDGRPVAKARIKQEIFLVDSEYKQILAGRTFHYVDKGYAPKSDQKIMAHTRRPEKEVEWMETNDDVLKLAATVNAMIKHDTHMAYWQVEKLLCDFLTAPRMLNPAVENDKILLWRLGEAQKNTKAFAANVQYFCRLNSEYEYLNYKE
jgi:hypothetical protein